MNKIKFGALVVALFMCMSFAACKNEDNTEEESSIPEASGGVTGDMTISDVSTDDEDENERQERLQAQAYDIVHSNTEYSERFAEFREKLLTKDCTMIFKKDEKSNNGDYTYKYVNNGDNWYYSMTAIDVDNGNKKSEYEYFEKDGEGYSFDYDNKVIVKIGNDKIVKTRTSVLPILSGISLKEQIKDNFKGNEYNCDIYNYTTAEYADDFKNLVANDAGTVKVFYDKDNNVVGISVITNDGINGYDIQITGFENKADTSVFNTEKEGFKLKTADEYLAS